MKSTRGLRRHQPVRPNRRKYKPGKHRPPRERVYIPVKDGVVQLESVADAARFVAAMRTTRRSWSEGPFAFRGFEPYRSAEAARLLGRPGGSSGSYQASTSR